MANFREHVTVSGACGAAYGLGMYATTPIDVTQACVAGTLTGVAGMLPDLDSDNGRPIRELTSLVAAAVPFVLVRRFVSWTGSFDGVVFLGILTYGLIRYGGANLLRQVTVHRGMFHSLPAMLIAGLLTFLAYKSGEVGGRLLMGTGVMVGFASHLMLDEWYSVSWGGGGPRLKASAGTAVKWAGPDGSANLACYALLCVSAYAVAVDGGLIAVDRLGVPQKVRHAGELRTAEADGGPAPPATL